MKKYRLLLCINFFTLLCPLNLLANERAFTESEARQLPPFCLGLPLDYFQDSAKYLKTNVKVLGKDTHHFCHGMKLIIRGDKGDKSAYETAINEFDYVEGHASSISENELLDSVSLYKAEALGKLGKTGPAIAEYNKAIQLNNKYHQAYARLADYYLTLGMKQDAIDTIKIGLRFSPESKGLKNRLHKLSADK